jgi:hypothetical protein
MMSAVKENTIKTNTMRDIDDIAPRQVHIHEMDMNTIGSSAHIGLYGDPGMGKTRMAKRLTRFFTESRKVTCVFVVVGDPETASESSERSEWVRELHAGSHVYQVFNSEQPEAVARLDALNDHALLGALVIFDDPGDDFMRSQSVLRFAVHDGGAFSTIWCMQHVYMMPKRARMMHTHVGIFHTGSDTMLDHIYEYALCVDASVRLSNAQFNKLFRMLTRAPNHLMWIDKSRKALEYFVNDAAHELVRTENIKYDQHVKRVKTTSNVPLVQDDRFCFCWQCRTGKWIEANGHVVVAATAAVVLALAVKMAL